MKRDDTPPKFRWLRRLLAAAAFGTGVFVFWLFAIWPPPSWYRTHFPRETAFMAMRRRAAEEPFERKYLPVPAESIAPVMRRAAMVAEDHRFYEHGGIDFLAVLEAMGYRRSEFSWDGPRDRKELERALQRAWSRRDDIRGASTITQQLAKNLYLSPSRNPLRKVKEAVTAWRMEAALGKDRILELYLNVVELGDEVWGVEAASREYFRRSAARLSWEQAAALAGTLPHPRTSNPAHRPGRMRWRQNMILERLRRGG